MKPESIKSILRSYLRERQHSSSYNDVASYLHEPPEYIPDLPCFSYAPSKHRLGKPFHCAGKIVDDLEVLVPQSAGPLQDEHNDLVVMQFQSADLPWDEHNVPLEPQLDELAIGVGRRLSQMSDEFDLNLIVPLNNHAPSIGNGCIQFKERIIRVPATYDHVQIPIIRTRAADGVANATWRTCDKSAKAGLHYVNSQGNISFGQDDEEKTIQVEIIRDQERRTDIHFAIELFDSEGTFNTLTVYILDDSRLYPEEKQCIKNIFSCARNSSMSEIVTCLHDKVTHNTFKAALLCLCSNADTIPKELALGAELLRLTMVHAPLSTLTNVLCGYFSYLPELKPESIKSILRSYLKERQYSSSYDDIDGIGYPEYLSGEPFDSLEGRANDLLFMQPHSPELPLDELNVPLPPEEERLAIQFGRQLSQMSDEFRSDHTDAARSRSNSANESRSVQFKKHIIHVPPTCDRVQIPIIRTSAADRVVNATWRTCDKSAKAGLHYVNSQGSISFAQDDEEKSIEVLIIRDQDKRNDIHFAVELYDTEGTFNTLMIYIRDDSKLYPEERQVVENIFNCGRDISVSEVVTRLSDNVTHNTFKAALLCLSSCADSIPNKEFALGAELLRLTIPHARFSLLTNVFCEFFSYLPELEDLASMF